MILAECAHNFSTSYGLPLSLLLAGLVGGFTHCAGMCSPFVLAQTGQVKKLRGALLLPYHLGRMTTYVALAVLVNGFINMAFLFSDLKVMISAPLLMLAGLIFMVTAFPSLGQVFPWVTRLQISLPYRFFANLTQSLSHNPGILKRYGMGVLLGFMPCGLVLAALMAVASAPTPMHAAMAMMGFTVGTMPALILVGLGGQALRYKFPYLSARLKQGALMISGFWLFLMAGLMFF